MIGRFITAEACEKELKNQGFFFYTTCEFRCIFINKHKKEIAEIYVYSDNSASALIGGYSGDL